MKRPDVKGCRRRHFLFLFAGSCLMLAHSGQSYVVAKDQAKSLAGSMGKLLYIEGVSDLFADFKAWPGNQAFI